MKFCFFLRGLVSKKGRFVLYLYCAVKLHAWCISLGSRWSWVTSLSCGFITLLERALVPICRRVGEPCSRFGCVTSKLARSKPVSGVTRADTVRNSFITKLVHRILKRRENVSYKNTPIGLFAPFHIWASQPVYKLTTVDLRVICFVVKVWWAVLTLPEYMVHVPLGEYLEVAIKPTARNAWRGCRGGRIPSSFFGRYWF
jgi:hypothetical protein